MRHEIERDGDILFPGSLFTPWPVKLQFNEGVSVNQRNFKSEKSGSIGLQIINKHIIDIKFHRPPRFGPVSQRVRSERTTEGGGCICNLHSDNRVEQGGSGACIDLSEHYLPHPGPVIIDMPPHVVLLLFTERGSGVQSKRS